MRQAISYGQTLLNFNPEEARVATGIFARMFPADQHGPGATEIGVVEYLDNALAGPYSDHVDTYRLALAAINRVSRHRYGASFADSSLDRQDAILVEVENGTLPGLVEPVPGTFFELLRTHLQEGLFCDPVYGGNRDKLGWKVLGHPGVWLENSAEENLTDRPVTKGGSIQSLADLGLTARRSAADQYQTGYDPYESILPPSEMVDVIIVGVGIQPDTLSYTSNFLDIDPVHRDTSGLGLPVMRITYDMRGNEHKLANWMETKAEEILRAMGAVKTWRGPRFTGVGSCHDLGGARMGTDPTNSVTSPELAVHDTPGLYLFSGATFPTCPGINPTLTLWAVCYRATQQLTERLHRGEER
jgi:hypothetical protein